MIVNRSIITLIMLVFGLCSAHASDTWQSKKQVQHDDDVTCVWVKSHNTYYCETGTFDDLLADCLTTSDKDACCVVTGEASLCGKTVQSRFGTFDFSRMFNDDSRTLTFSRKLTPGGR